MLTNLILLLFVSLPSFAASLTTEQLVVKEIILGTRSNLNLSIVAENSDLGALATASSLANLSRTEISHQGRKNEPWADRVAANAYEGGKGEIVAKIAAPCFEFSSETLVVYFKSMIETSKPHYQILTSPQWKKFGLKLSSAQMTAIDGECCKQYSLSIVFGD